MDGLSRELQTGKAGEHFVCYDLIQKGYNAFLADQGLPYDVLVDTDGTILKIQVKTISKIVHGYYAFNIRKGKGSSRLVKVGSLDYIAFVFLDIKEVQYVPTRLLKTEDSYFKQSIIFYTEPRDDQNRPRKYVIGRFNSL